MRSQNKLGVLPILFLLNQLILKGTCLKCYSCINLQCPDSHPFLCERANEYVRERLNEIYFSYGNRVPFCPAPDDEDGWNSLVARSDRCGVETGGEATCSLGRFKVTTTIMDTRENITSYGTSLGCAKRRLLDVAKIATRRSECSLVMGHSPTRDSLQHFLEIEHCFTGSEMCRSDFCINPEISFVKTFREDSGKSSGSFGSFGVIIVCIALLAIIVIVLFFLGIKYDK